MILSIEYRASQGWPSAQAKLKRRISAYVRPGRAKHFKVGITNDPATRAGQHNQKKHKYDKMVVLYATQSQRNAQQIETWLIELYRNRADNERAGGAGRYGGTAWKYVYVLLG
jgi:predicted GIY-YIG superfamily endonuclease